MKGLSPQGTVPLRKPQRGYLLITVVVALFLIATVAILLTHDSAISANTSSTELEAARAEYVTQAGMQHAVWRTANNACMGDVTIPATTLGSDSYTATVTGAAAGTFHSLTADQDAWIRSDDTSKNNGTTASNHIRNETAGTEQVLTRFDIASIAANAQINSAVAWFHLKATKEHPEGPINVHEIIADWGETTVTWDSFGGAYRTGSIGMIPAQDTGDVWVAINLTGSVQAWVNGQPNNGILFESQAEGIHTEYTAREDGANPPRLEVVVGSGPASPVTVQATGTLDNGVTRTLSRPINPAYQPPGTVTLQLGTDPGADAMLDDFYPRNYGGRDYVQVNGNPSWLQRPVFRFGLGRVPADVAVLSAQLELRMRNIVAPGTATVHRVTRSWVEGTKTGTGTADGATWATHDGSNNWTTAGGDFNAAAIAEATIEATDTWVSWEIGPLVEQWLAGELNNGLLLKADGALREIEFYTKEEADATLHPKLTITYACECGSACMAPQGSGNVLMVVQDDLNPDIHETSQQALLESWGYSVELISEGESQAAFDTAFGNNDVVYMTGSANPPTVGTKLTNAPIGVVSNNGGLNDELGISSTRARPIGTGIDVTDTSHYITAPFAGGGMEIYTAAMKGLTATGTLAPGLQTLAQWGADTSLAVLDQGATLVGGGSSPARRVILSFGRAEGSNLDWRHVNNNGLLILQRALQWGTGNTGAAPSKQLLFVTASLSPTAQEQLRIDLIESWGYSVNLIADEDTQVNFDTAMSVANVVYVSLEVSATSLGTKLVDSTIGVVNEHGDLIDDFGMASGNPTAVTLTNASIIDNVHYITDSFLLGDLTLASPWQPFTYVNAGVAAGVQVLADVFNKSSLLVADTGAELLSSTPAPGRRVQLPWGSGGFDFSALNADAKTIMQRAIEWADTASAGNTYAVLMIVADPASPAQAAADRKTLMESWGYTVTLIDDDDSTVNLITAIDVADVIYVGAGTTNTDGVIKVLTNIPKGVVNEPSLLVSDIGFSSGINVAFAVDALTIIDSTHSITQGFASPVTVFTALAVPTVLSGTLSPDLQNLGEFLAAPAVAVLESGAARHNVGVTPGRRAQLPFEAALDSDLAADGQLIVRRAIEWAAGDGLGPIAHWKLDDGTGLTAVDSEGGHDGTLANGPGWVAGQLGDALEFTGGTEYVDLTSDAELDDVFVGGATVMAWINPNDWGDNGYGRVFDKSSSPSSTGDGWAIRLNKDNDGLNFGQGFTGGRGWWRLSTDTISLDTWQHIAVAYDASSTANDPIIYIGGSSVPITTVDTPSGDIRTDASINLRLGNHAGGTDHTFKGVIDDARIYDGMLGAAEIADIAAGGGGGGGGGGGPAEYLDNFDAVVYSGSDGVDDWSANPWQELTESDGPASGKLFIANDPVVAQSASERLVVDSRFTELKRPVNLSGFSSAWLSFLYRRDGYPTPNDYFAVLVSDNGSTWTQLERIYGIANDPVYRAAVYDISAYATSNTEIQIATGGINNNQTLYVDNMRVASTPLAGCAGIFADKFDTKSYANNDGTLNWASDWTEIKESNGPTQGDIQVRNEINDHQLRVRDDGYGVWREADLTAAGTATLILDFKRVGLDSSSDYVTVDVSGDGGSTWTELDRFAGSGNDNLYQFRYYDITAHATANTRIRFLGSASLGGQDQVWFDDIEIVCTP